MSDLGENEEQQKKKQELIKEIEDVIASAEIEHSEKPEKVESKESEERIEIPVEKEEEIVSETPKTVEPVKELVEDVKIEAENESVDIIENKEGYAEIVEQTPEASNSSREEKHEEKKEHEEEPKIDIEPVKFTVIPAKQHDIEIPAKHEDHHSEEPKEEKPVEVAKPVEKKAKKWDFENVSDSFEADQARIVVIGVGGAGNNTVTALKNMAVEGATTIVVNTDVKHLKISKADKKVLIGKTITKGLGAGGYPETGKNAALENKKDIKEILKNVDLVFLTGGLGGGTGTGAMPVIARMAKESGSIVIAAVTLPFKLEGARIVRAEEGLIQLRESCDTVIVIENQRLLQMAGNMPLKNAFAVADNLISTMIKGITETIYVPSLVNLDYADVKAIMKLGGVASIGIGESDSGNERAEEAVMKALNHPLLDIDYHGAKGALVQVIGGENMRLEEVNRIGEIIQAQLDENTQIIWGARVIPGLDKLQVITIITGVKSPYILGPAEKIQKHKVSKELGIDFIRSAEK